MLFLLQLLQFLATCVLAHPTLRWTRTNCPNAAVKRETTSKSGVVTTQFVCGGASKPRSNGELAKRDQVADPNSGLVAMKCLVTNASPTVADCDDIANFFIANNQTLVLASGDIWQYGWKTCEVRVINSYSQSDPCHLSIGATSMANAIENIADACTHGGGEYRSIDTIPESSDVSRFIIDVVPSGSR